MSQEESRGLRRREMVSGISDCLMRKVAKVTNLPQRNFLGFQ